MLLSDHPGGVTGLGRITNAIATNIHTRMQDTFRVAVAGFGPGDTANIPYPVYQLNWKQGLPDKLPLAWRMFAGDEPGIAMMVMNAAWGLWLAIPDPLEDSDLKSFLTSGKIKTWAYVPVDSESIGGRLPKVERRILQGFDRVLGYTEFGARLINDALEPERPRAAWLPHGTDGKVFYPRDRQMARDGEFVKRVFKGAQGKVTPGTLLLGCVATNTRRKNWALAFETCAELVRRGEDVGLWAHTNAVHGAWDLLTMAEEFGLQHRVLFSTEALADEDMAWGYSACDVVLGIANEGWGMPLAEALACGVPVVTGNYAGATQFVPKEMLVDPVMFDYDGFYCSRRPIFNHYIWADKVQELKGSAGWLDPQYLWENCWVNWERWLKEGL
jgi:glycosyltransferase involved in cell wall biosynthesis